MLGALSAWPAARPVAVAVYRTIPRGSVRKVMSFWRHADGFRTVLLPAESPTRHSDWCSTCTAAPRKLLRIEPKAEGTSPHLGLDA